MDPSPPTRSSPLRHLNGVHREGAAAVGILGEALRLSLANCRLSLPATLSVLLPCCLLSLGQQLLFDPSSLLVKARPLHARIPRRAAPSPSSSGLTSEWTIGSNILVLADFAFLVCFWVLDLFELTVTVFAASAAYRGDRPGLLGELLRRTRRDWRGPVSTQLCVTVLRTGYWGVLGVFADALLPLAAGPTSWLLMAMGSLLFLSGNLLYYYLDVAWESSLAASAVDGCGGFRALGLAGELTGGRWRRLQGVVLVLLYAAAGEATSLLFDLLTGLDMAEAVHVALVVVSRSVFEVMYMYRLTAFTVFYYKCRGSRWEEGGHYSRLPTSPHS